jgi:hypothetical protein
MLPTDLSRLPKAIELVIHQMVHNLRLADVHRQLLGYVQVYMVNVREMVADAWEEWGLIGNPRALMPEKYAPGGTWEMSFQPRYFTNIPKFAKSVHSRMRRGSWVCVYNQFTPNG